MKRYSEKTNSPGEPADNSGRTRFEENGSDYSLEQVGDGFAAGEAHRRQRGHAVGVARRHEPELQAEPVGVYMMSTPLYLHLAHLCERLSPLGGGSTVGEQGSESLPFDGAQPEAERMLGKVLAAGGTGIVERLKEQEAKIAAAPCEQPEIWRMVEAYYVPLLLDALALSDEEFDAEYPGEGRVPAKQRAELAEAIERHAQGCPRCSLKVSSDREWDDYVENVAEKAADRDGRRFRVRV
jgi:hypothetical protein